MAKPIIAIMYDFDKTLSTKDMQNYGFIPNLGLTPQEFWGETEEVCNKHNMDKILGYMYVMVSKCKEKGIKLTKEYLKSLGKGVELFKGVETWFDRINRYAEALGLRIEHYIISSGTKEIIEGTTIAKEFKRIYGCEFMYNEDKVAIWPKISVNYTNKTQYVYRISKGALEESEEEKLNSATTEENRRVAYENMIYIGDGMTDIPCMKVVKSRGGKAIAIYQPGQKEKVQNLVRDNRINYVCPGDYRENSRVEKIVKLILDHMAATHKVKVTEEKIINEYKSSMKDNN